MKFMMSFAILAAATMAGTAANAFPLTGHRWGAAADSVGFLYSKGFNYNGIIAMSNCSGSLVRFKSSQDTDLAMILTNGHCVGGGAHGSMLAPGEVLHNVARKFRVELLDKKASGIKTLVATRILYATMTDTDVGLLELNETYADIRQKTSTEALVLADTVTPTGLPIDVASGYWERTYTCATEAIVPMLREGDWTFKNSVRYSPTGCEVVGGTSGSPIISKTSGEVAAINNTINEDGESCTLNNPCEVDADGKTHVLEGRGYGQQIYLFYGCLGAGTDRIDLTKAGCALPKP
jgi:hypothetical protein